jgi:hypothetical protein
MEKKQLRSWQPTPEEVERMVSEMRPIIADLVRRQFETAKRPA